MRVVLFIGVVLGLLQAREIPLSATKVCQKCHPLIYEEYTRSMHARASIFNDEVHNAIWQRHPAHKKGNYKCKKCHTPVDTSLKDEPQKNDVQLHAPISCVYCHRIKDVRYHAKSNENILSDKKDTLYGARKAQKNRDDVTFETKKSFFGLITKQEGSPYHHIDFTNENYYSGKTCMGCHSHKQNAHGFNVCDMKVSLEELKNKKNCIECHMPKVQGSFTTLKNSPTHRFHGFAGVSNDEHLLAKYLDIDIKGTSDGFVVTLTNKATHELLLHPMRLGELRVTLYHNGQKKPLPSHYFKKVLGHQGKASAPWVATQLLQDTHLKAGQSKSFEYKQPLHKGDTLEVVFGFYKVNPKIAKKLQLKDPQLSKFKILKKVERVIE